MNLNSLLAAFALTDYAVIPCLYFTLAASCPVDGLIHPETTPKSPVSHKYLSPPQRFPLDISIKIAIIEKIESARRASGKKEKCASLLSSLLPSCPVPSLFLSPQPPHNTKRPLPRRESQYRSQIHPSHLVTNINFLLSMSIEKQGGKGVFRDAWWDPNYQHDAWSDPNL